MTTCIAEFGKNDERSFCDHKWRQFFLLQRMMVMMKTCIQTQPSLLLLLMLLQNAMLMKAIDVPSSLSCSSSVISRNLQYMTLTVRYD